jgi:amino acid transporter
VSESQDEKTLASMGYTQELLRRMSGFSSFAISFSIICILAGGLTSFHLGFSSVGGAAIGIGWPVSCLLSLACALTMAQVASAFPTAGALYHWSSILGGRAWGWLTAWLNILGLVTVLAAINVGTYLFAKASLGPAMGIDVDAMGVGAQVLGVSVITLSQALFNHLGIRLTTILTDLSGYLILIVASVLTIAMLAYAPAIDFSRLYSFTNYSGPAGGAVWPRSESLPLMFLLGFMLPAYTVTGFDAAAHTSEETVNAARVVPRGIVSSVLISGIAGWVMLCAVVLAIPDMSTVAAAGDKAFYSIFDSLLPRPLALALYVGIVVAQYLCGLATVTSASRVTFAFARDGGLPFSQKLARVSARYKTPMVAIWAVGVLVVAFTVYTPVYSTITAVCVIFLYVSYVVPTFLGLLSYRRAWRRMGPFDLGRWYRVLAVVAILGCLAIIGAAVQPPNDKALWIMLGALGLSAVVWFGFERRRFEGPPKISLT